MLSMERGSAPPQVVELDVELQAPPACVVASLLCHEKAWHAGVHVAGVVLGVVSQCGTPIVPAVREVHAATVLESACLW